MKHSPKCVDVNFPLNWNHKKFIFPIGNKKIKKKTTKINDQKSVNVLWVIEISPCDLITRDASELVSHQNSIGDIDKVVAMRPYWGSQY